MAGNSTTTLSDWLGRTDYEALRVALAESPDIVALVDHDLAIRYINYTQQGFDRERLIGASLLDITPPDYHDKSRAAFAQVLETGVAARYEVIFKGVGELHVWSVRVGPLRVDGQIVGAVVMNSEVSEQHRQSVERDRFFLLSLDMLTVANPEGQFTRVNPALERTLGYSAAELLSRPFLEFVHPEDKLRTRQSFEAVLGGAQITDFENRYRCSDGGYRTLSWRATVDPLTGEVYSVARDITQQRSVEIQLRHAQKMEAVGQLAGGIAHDFNNLMLAVLANAELALSEESVSANVAECLTEIQTAGERAAALTKQLLAFSRQQPLRTAIVDLNELLQSLMKMLRRLLPASIAFELVPGHRLASVDADPTQLEQVIVNLCVNARDAMTEGGRLTIETENILINQRYVETHPWAKPGRYVLLTVTDTGAGMTREAQERAFEPFYTTKPMHQGTGLGLSTVYGIVRRHDGMVHIYSELGQGTTFRVYLPSSGRQVEHVENELQPIPPRGQETILLAEDEPQVRRAVAQSLERAGYRLILACDGAEAVNLLKRTAEPVDLAILDVVMPELGGPEAWEQIRASRPGMRVLFASGYADNRYGARLPEGAQLLEKPFRIDALLRRVRHSLESSTDARPDEPQRAEEESL